MWCNPASHPEKQQEIVTLVDKILAAKEKEQTDLFASNDAHNKKVKGVSPEQIRVLSKNRKGDLSTCAWGDTAAADTSEAGGHVECSETSVWEKQIDKLVYALYNLTEEEIKIVEEQK